MRHFAGPSFWKAYQSLPAEIQDLSDRSFDLLKTSSDHPSLHLKKVGKYWSARIGENIVPWGWKLMKAFSGFGLAHLLNMTS
jgi:hypothetical protein